MTALVANLVCGIWFLKRCIFNEIDKLLQQRINNAYKGFVNNYNGQQYRGGVPPRIAMTPMTGLGNLGNTCYMNSVLQALFMCDGFREEIINTRINPQQYLLTQLQDVFIQLASKQSSAYSPVTFLKASQPPWFTAGHQQDCSEYLRYLLNRFHEEELNVIRSEQPNYEPPNDNEVPNPSASSSCQELINNMEKTLIHRIFGGQMRTTLQCLNCQMALSQTENFTDIPLALPNQCGTPVDPTVKLECNDGDHDLSANPDKYEASITPLQLEDLIQYNLTSELLYGDNQYNCEICGGLQDAKRTQAITHPPEVLLLNLLRFAYNIETQTCSKIFTEVDCPKTIRIPVTTSGLVPADNTPGSKKATFYLKPLDTHYEVYCLCSIVVHSGASSESGHYYCYGRHDLARSPSNDESDEDYFEDNWYLFNGTQVTFSTFANLYEDTRDYPEDSIFLLLYKRIHKLNPMSSKRDSETNSIFDDEELEEIDYWSDQGSKASSHLSRNDESAPIDNKNVQPKHIALWESRKRANTFQYSGDFSTSYKIRKPNMPKPDPTYEKYRCLNSTALQHWMQYAYSGMGKTLALTDYNSNSNSSASHLIIRVIPTKDETVDYDQSDCSMIPYTVGQRKHASLVKRFKNEITGYREKDQLMLSVLNFHAFCAYILNLWSIKGEHDLKPS